MSFWDQYRLDAPQGEGVWGASPQVCDDGGGTTEDAWVGEGFGGGNCWTRPPFLPPPAYEEPTYEEDLGPMETLSEPPMCTLADEGSLVSEHAGAWPDARLSAAPSSSPKASSTPGELPFLRQADRASSVLDIVQASMGEDVEFGGFGGLSGLMSVYTGAQDFRGGTERARAFSDQPGAADDELVAAELRRARLEQGLGGVKMLGGLTSAFDGFGGKDTKLGPALEVTGGVLGGTEGLLETWLGAQTLWDGGRASDEEDAMRQVLKGPAGILGAVPCAPIQMVAGSFAAGATYGEGMYEDSNEKFRGASAEDAPIQYDLADYSAEAGRLAREEYLSGIEDPTARQLRVANRRGAMVAASANIIDTLGTWWD